MATQQGPFKILILEDDTSVVETVKTMLQQSTDYRFQCLHTDYLSAGLGILRANGISLVILDLELPDSFGFDGLQKVLTQSPNTPVVVFTGHDNPSDALRAVEMGAQDYLVKPVTDFRLFNRALCNAIARHRNLMESRNRIDELEKQIHSRVDSAIKKKAFVFEKTWKLWSAVLLTAATILYTAAQAAEKIIALLGK